MSASTEQPTPIAGYTTDADHVIRRETDYILEGRDPGLGHVTDLRGLAISGGGIRSASLGLGILQALVAGHMLPKIDYLSTVSGGGYIGSSLTWLLKRGLGGKKAAGTTPESFPFGRARVGGRLATADSPNSILDFLRQHGNYLIPGQGLTLVALIGVTLRGLLVSLLVYFCLLASVMLPAVNLDLFEPRMGRFVNIFTLLAGGSLILLLLSSVGYSLRTYFRLGNSEARYAARTSVQRWLGILLVATVFLCVLASLPIVPYAAVTAGSSTVGGGILGLLRQLLEQRRAKPRGLPAQTMAILAAAGLIYGLVLGAYVLSGLECWSSAPWIASAGFATIGLLVGAFVNLNYLALHRMYRDRLMEAFLPNPENVRTNRWGLATDADGALIEEMCQAPNRRPYHLINTNVVLVASPEAKFAGRGGDSFVLSPRYCGSNATGWIESKHWMKRGGRGMTLPTAMAISGAAANPNTGVAGQGLMRNRLVAVLMTLLNIRLGYWAPNPGKPQRLPLPANFLWPGLSALLGLGLHESRSMIELTDGGHFENLGLYELVRRRAKVIVVSDGGCDPNFRFDDLTNATQRVRVDFGVQITFDDPDYDLRWLQPGSASDQPALATEKYDLARRGFAIGTIRYPDGTAGTLIYFKSTVTPDLSPDIYGYKAAHPDFPHQTTADQFFDESQFEAYRELGYYLGWQMLSANGHPEAEPSKTTQPPWL